MKGIVQQMEEHQPLSGKELKNHIKKQWNCSNKEADDIVNIFKSFEKVE